jgi:hypothetical protein
MWAQMIENSAVRSQRDTHDEQFQRPTDKGFTRDEEFPSLMAVDVQRPHRHMHRSYMRDMGAESRKKKIRAEEITETY